MSRQPSEQSTFATPSRAHVRGWNRPAIRRNLRLVFEGGPEGQRRAALIFLLTVAPISIAVGAQLSHHDRTLATLLRFAILAVAIVWLILRATFRTRDWAGLLVLITAANVASQLTAGADHNGVLALNGLGVFVLVCIAFESRLVVVAGSLFTAAYAAVQLHFYPIGDAAAAVVMYMIVLAVAALVVHGTALYLRDSLRRTAELHAEMEQTAEQERARIAGGLHDDTIQVLTAAGLRLDELTRRLEAGHEPDIAANAHDVRELIRHALDRTRRLTFELHPPQLEQQGLRPTVEALGRQAEAESTFSVAVSVGPGRFPRPVEQLAYRTIKELLANASKHSQARRVTIDVAAHGGELRCVVEDDGRGFAEDARAEARSQFHIGLDAAAERVRAAGGELEIASVAGHGTRASFTLPTGAGAA